MLIRFDFRKALFARGKDVAAQRVKTTNQGAVRMNAAALLIEEHAGSVIFPIQNGSGISGVTLNELRRGQTAIDRQTHDLVWIHLDFFVAAAFPAPLAGE